ncbi:hypothetical protein Vadar_017949 [Vaccinium darrowii]|uniref:Uncharacterized protein n=1 Tax=Vaccinium darrowii TaxID=229202 RepID=A0ACB7X1S6_9ERIC|nr:hypothetical protein Vadar_017949 [Vaccinium darrowii]
MANFKAFVMAIAASNPKRPLTPSLKTLIQNRFNQFFPDSHTPDHPTYAAMIIAALGDLNEEGGFSEDDEKTREQKLQTSVIEEQKQPEEEQNDVSEGQTLGQQIEVIEGKGISLDQQSGVIMEPDKRLKQEIKLPENRSQMAEHQSRVVEGLSWSQIHKQLQQEREKPHPRKLVILDSASTSHT